MAPKVFVDSDVIIDFLIDRRPHAVASSIVFDWAEKGRIKVYASALSLNNVHYIIRKVVGQKKSREVIGELLELIEVGEVTKEHISAAVKSEFKDFEDAIQHEVAIGEKSIQAIITRNTKDYKKSFLPVFPPEIWVKMMENEEI